MKVNFERLDIVNIQEIIDSYNLTDKNRKQDLVYRRAYLYYCLRKCGYTYQHIAMMFDKNHASIINGIKVHKQLTESKDKYYKFFVDDLNQMLQYSEIKPNIFEDIMQARTVLQLNAIQERIKANLY